MSFNDDITIDTSGVNRGRRGAAIGGGVGGLGLLGALLLYFFTGQVPDLGSLVSSGQQSAGTSQQSISQECKTGADANSKDECRMAAGKNSLDEFWNTQLSKEAGVQYHPAGLMLYRGSVGTACGTGSSQTGPFYCPSDASVYIDTTFFNQLKQYGAQNTSLAQLYILAHEWGHHIQNHLGILNKIDHQSSGMSSSMVRSELQADCLAGVWINNASSTIDPDTGIPFLKPPTQQQLRSALDAASAVGDDRIMENAGMRANPDRFSHGSSQKRMEWLTRGIKGGTIASCDTWSVRQP
ncbi:neutral zinc metallopeptidase [Arcanobacterium bovis]|uniref:Metallopeptidase n=1 Tax=Arcanobacterium bovis TaxID=2529275 RepID=A0A4Q9V3E7_9ACTO|nr:neutral zinc metallopeptidase [Arcanobacterium bovis]TBW23002.1 metallopeptidase [Arcanobacterium bovis]